MPLTPTGYQRRNTLRHPGYDYTRAGAYFVTICTHRGRPMFGQVCEQTMILNPLGQIAEQAWHQVVERHAAVFGDAYVIMPNHVHLLVWLDSCSDSVADAQKDNKRAFGKKIAGSLSTIVSAYKGSVTQQAKYSGLIPALPLWQRNFYDHIVRNEADAQRIHDYIGSNPARWHSDQLHPQAEQNRFNRSWRRS